jgi:hypothetical protein
MVLRLGDPVAKTLQPVGRDVAGELAGELPQA